MAAHVRSWLFLATVLASAMACRTADPGDSGRPDPGAEASSGSLAEVLSRDINGDGSLDTVRIFAAGPGGEPGRAEADTTGDGRVDFWAILGPDGQSLREVAYDTDGDEAPDTWELFSADGLYERRRDLSGDGLADSWTFYSSGLVTERHEDADRDGRPDTWVTYWAQGTTRRAAHDTDGDGRPDRWLNYDEAGAVTSVESDTDGDGVADAFVSPRR